MLWLWRPQRLEGFGSHPCRRRFSFPSFARNDPFKVDLYGTALVLEEFGNVIVRDSAGVVMPLSAEQPVL